MKKIMKEVKRLASMQINKSVSRQKHEWPATSLPVYFQPERPQAGKISYKTIGENNNFDALS